MATNGQFKLSTNTRADARQSINVSGKGLGYNKDTGVITINSKNVLSTVSTDDLSEGQNNNYYSSILFNNDFSNKIDDIRSISKDSLSVTGNPDILYNKQSGVFNFSNLKTIPVLKFSYIGGVDFLSPNNIMSVGYDQEKNSGTRANLNDLSTSPSSETGEYIGYTGNVDFSDKKLSCYCWKFELPAGRYRLEYFLNIYVGGASDSHLFIGIKVGNEYDGQEERAVSKLQSVLAQVDLYAIREIELLGQTPVYFFCGSNDKDTYPIPVEDFNSLLTSFKIQIHEYKTHIPINGTPGISTDPL